MQPATEALLPFQVSAPRALQQAVVRPGRAVQDRGGVGGAGHGPKVALVLLLIHVLRFVDLQQDIGRRAHHVAGAVGREEEDARVAQAQHVAMLALPAAVGEGHRQFPLQALLAGHKLRHEGRRGLDDLAAAFRVQGEQVVLQRGRRLVLAHLPGHHDADDIAVSRAHAICYCTSDLALIGAQRARARHGGEARHVGQQGTHAAPALDRRVHTPPPTIEKPGSGYNQPEPVPTRRRVCGA